MTRQVNRDNSVAIPPLFCCEVQKRGSTCKVFTAMDRHNENRTRSHPPSGTFSVQLKSLSNWGKIMSELVLLEVLKASKLLLSFLHGVSLVMPCSLVIVCIIHLQGLGIARII